MLDYLDRLGHRIDAMTVPGTSGTAMEAASGYLYDLSSAAALASTSAETYPIPGGSSADPPIPGRAGASVFPKREDPGGSDAGVVRLDEKCFAISRER